MHNSIGTQFLTKTTFSDKYGTYTFTVSKIMADMKSSDLNCWEMSAIA